MSNIVLRQDNVVSDTDKAPSDLKRREELQILLS